MRNSLLFLVLVTIDVLLLTASPGFADDATSRLEPAARFRVIRPAVLAARINRLFDGAKVPHPAAALSAWKRATHGRGHLGKPLEAMIALFNPEMASEWRSLDGSELTVWATRETGDGAELEWSVVVPHDDGSVAAALMASRLTEGGLDGESVPPGQAAVDRLGPPGAPLTTRIGRTLVIAGSHRSLKRAVAELAANAKSAPVQADSETPGIRFQIDGGLLECVPGRVRVGRAAAELGHASEGRRLEGLATLEGDTASIRFHASAGPPGNSPLLHSLPIEQEWLGWVPRPDAMAAAVVRFDTSPSTWDSLFTLIDRIEKADPAKSGTMPFRTRFNILLGVARVRPEIDLWPHLLGVTATLLGDRGRTASVPGVLLALHMDQEPSARNVCDVLAPRVAEFYLRRQGESSEKPADAPRATAEEPGIRTLGEVGGRPVLVARNGCTVLLGWGGVDVVTRGLRLAPDRARAARELLPAQPEAFDFSRLVLIWPGRLGLRIPGIVPDSAADRVLTGSVPIVWTGGGHPETNRPDDAIVWRDLDQLVTKFLETLPLEVSDRR